MTASVDPSSTRFAALPLDSVVAERAALLGRIKLCFGADRASFDRELTPLIRRYAAYVHLLPATERDHFSGPGGLFQLGLETAFFSLQGTDAHIFSGRATISARRELEPRWRIATFAGGLCCELHRVLSQVVVTTAEGEEWPAFLLPLAEWLQQRGADRYFLRWRPHAVEVRSLGLFALPLVVPAALVQQLAHGDGAIARQLFACIGGLVQPREPNVLNDLVRRALALVIDRNLNAHTEPRGAPRYGSHLERYLVDAMCRLAATHSSWVPNREKSRLWYGEDGLYLSWPGAAKDVLQLLEDDQLAGMPKTPETILQLLLETGVFESMPGGGRTWPILAPGTKDPIDAVKLASPSILLVGVEPAQDPLPHRLHCSQETPSASAAGSIGRTRSQAPPPAAPPAQLSLIEPDAPGSHAAAASELELASSSIAPAPSPAVAPLRPIQLKAPMRLHPDVRQAVAHLIDGLNDPPDSAAVFTVAEGVFVPLAELERCGVQPTAAVRALADAGMLIKPTPAGPSTVSLDVRGTPAVGVIVHPSFVLGLEPAAFVSDASRGS